ncbi:MAG: serine/threonine-protein kinase [Pseudomonadota bacterium]
MDEKTVLAPGGGRPFVGKYLIESTLGEGAMGVVYAGLDPDIQRPVAIKTIHAHLMQTPDRAELLERFAREARAAGRVLHPNLVTIFDFLLEDGMPYLVMERVQSVTLKGHCTDAARLSLREIHDIARQMLAGLSAIHAAGIVHRDMKPANVMLTEDGTVKLTDFGIARLTSMDATSIGMIGTPAYMAPEQMMGNAVDARADIYATGVMLYELLTGRKPYPGGGVEAMFQAIHNTTVTPPSALVPALPEALDAVVLRAMQIDPAARYADAREMQAALDAAITGADQNTMIEVTAPPGTDPSHGGSDTMLNRMSVDTLRRVERHLTTSMGPMGSVIARRVAATARNAQEMLDAVLQDIPDETERTALRRVIERALHDDGAVRTDALTDTTLAQLGKLLTPYLGPIAPVLVKRHAATAVSHADLASVLADMINNPPERQQFLTEARALV